MEVVAVQNFPPIERQEKKLKIDWPEKKDLLDRKEAYLQAKLDETVDLLRKKMPQMKEELVEPMARVTLSAMFMMEEMQKLSPLPLGIPTYVQIIWDEKDEFPMGAKGFRRVGETKIFGVEVYLNLAVVSSVLYERHNPLRVSDEALGIIDDQNSQVHSFDEARKIAENMGKLRWKDMEVWAMSAAVHEFAHTLYQQEAYNKSSGPKMRSMEETGELNRAKEKLAYGEWRQRYLKLDVEHRARLWELSFLKRYFPDSGERYKADRDLRAGSVEEK